MIRCLVAVMRVVDRRVIYCFMALIVPFYMLFNHKGYISICRFFRRRLGFGPLKSFCKVYANHFRFGQVIIDRYAAYAGKTFNFSIDGNELFLNLMQSEGGFVQLSTHAGSFEMTGYGLTSHAKRINGLLFAGESQVMKDFRRNILASHNIGLIEVDGTMSHIFAMNAALDRGEIVSMTGDRLLGSPKALKCSFLGAEARFPMGPFALAVQKEVPMLAMFAMRENARSYRVFVRSIEPYSDLPLRARMTAMAQDFAAKLEEIVKQYPTQWFNYYDFWA